jgi:hypothetical protein
MPVDYTTLFLRSYDNNKILNNISLDFSLNVNEDGVLTDNKRVAKHHFCDIIVYDTGTVLVKGSLHKMYNSIKGIYAPNFKPKENYKGFNGNRFTYENLCFVISYLENLFKLNRFYFIIRKLEIGLNLSISYCPSKIISNLLESGGKLFEYRYNNSFAQVEYYNYYLKIYNKSLQYGMNGNLLRVEIKTRRMKEFEACGIKTLEDLTLVNLNKAVLRVLERWNVVLLYDCTIDESKLNTVQKKALKNRFQYPNYWKNIKASNKDNPKKKYLSLVNKYSENLHIEISNKIKNTKISHFN